MAVRVSLTHRTSYKYKRPAALGPQIIRLRPAPHNRTPLHSYVLRLQPDGHFLNWQQDAYGNYLARVVIPEKTQKFEVLVNLVADLEAYNPFDFFLEPQAEEFPFVYGEQDLENLETYIKPDPMTPQLAEFMTTIDMTKRRTVDFLVDLNRKVHSAVEYVIRMEPGVQTPEETLALARGSCRDSAWLFVQACRNLGLAARFVSGYLIQLEPDERPIEGPRGPERDFTDLHAWAEVYAPGAGWIGLDATSGLLVAEGHIPLACTPRPSSAAPVQGAVEQVETDFASAIGARLITLDDSEIFLGHLDGVTDPETKRKIIGREFIRVFEQAARDIVQDRGDEEHPVKWLVQGTLYPDVVESGGGAGTANIKSHHNVGGLPDDLQFSLIEPLRSLFKDEVRQVGLELGVPEAIVWRQPFPGPGLGIRIVGEVTAERLDVLRRADLIAREELTAAGLDRDIWQCPVVLLADVRSVGVQGDGRTYGHPIVLRPVSSEDAMTADWTRLPYDVLARISSRITNEVEEVNRVVLDVTSKPPGTIEWE